MIGRYMAFGMAAVAFTLLSSDASFATSLARSSITLLLLVAIAACLAIAADYLHLFSGWMSATLAADNEAGEYQNTPASKAWAGVQSVAFYAKQILVIAGAVTLVATIAGKVFS